MTKHYYDVDTTYGFVEVNPGDIQKDKYESYHGKGELLLSIVKDLPDEDTLHIIISETEEEMIKDDGYGLY